MQAADGVDIATVLAADEDFELRIDGAGVSDEGADHLFDGGMDGDERMTLEEFLVDVERQETVGVVAGNGECRLGEVVGTEGSEAIDGVNVIVMQFVWVFLGAVLFRLRLNTHAFRRYALGAYAPLRPAMCSTATRSVRIRQGGILIKHNHDTVLFLSFLYLRHMPRLYYFFKAFRIFDICRVSIFSLKSPPIISFARKT